ncbi:MAG: M1 family metallopeptidase [Spirulinaceae cyanobacterium SM2_1_0]|nr:M1 family metallopeptidase [Spirulinaceae cyanobacterium SM2_1_0]
MRLDLDFNIPQRCFRGICTLALQPIQPDLRHLSLDAVDLEIESVQCDNVAQPFDYDGQTLHIELLQPLGTEPVKLAIAYRAEQPQRGLYFIGPDAHYPDKPLQIWTQGEDEDSRYWFPGFDYPGQVVTSEVRVRIPKNLRAISNGELVVTETEGDAAIYHWYQRQPHPTYLITLAVGNFAELQQEWQGIPVIYYVERGREDQAQRSLGKTPRMLGFLSQKYGYDYPYSKYAQVCVADFIFGGMENTSTTLLTDRCLLDERAALDNQRTESLVVHELAHQWFGDLVAIAHWSHAWIKEGAASYSEVQWVEQEYGADEGAYYLLQEARRYLSEDRSRYRRPIVTNIYREAIELYDRHLYEKGACVYHMLRGQLGDEQFDRAIQTFLHDNAHQPVETVDLLRAIAKATGRNLAYLFDQYVFRGGHPEFKVSYAWDNNSKLAKVTVKQAQAKDDERQCFDLRLPLAFGDVSGQAGAETVSQETVTVRVHQVEQSFYFPLARRPRFFSFDAGNYTLKTLVLDYPLNELKAQLQYDPDPVSRIYAAIALAKRGGITAVKALAQALTGDRFWGVRAEVAAQLTKLNLDQAVEALQAGVSDTDPRVRRAVLAALSKCRTAASYASVQRVAEQGDASYYTEATALRSLGKLAVGQSHESQQQAIALLEQVLTERAGWNEVVRSGALDGLSQFKTVPAAVDAILPYTELGTPQALRLAAIRALGEVSTGQAPAQVELILARLEAIAGESFFLIQVAVSHALGHMRDAGALALLSQLAEQTADGRVRRLAEEAMKSVQKHLDGKKALQKLRDDLDQLKQENQDLRSRLARLEAKNSD